MNLSDILSSWQLIRNMATIGSIDHILKTTFRSVYEEYDKRLLASSAREQDLLKKL